MAPGMDFSIIDTVLFDFDGTLMDTNGLIVTSWRQTVKALAGREISVEEIRSSLGELLIDSMRRLIPEVDAEAAVDFYREYQRDIYLDSIRPFDGVPEVLRALHEAGYKVALVTSRLKSSTERGLDHFGLAGFFDAVLTASDTDKCKPDPEPIFIILDRIGKTPGQAVYIGDTVHDIEAGRAAGVVTGLVDWSFALPPEYRAAGPKPDFIIEKMQDILVLLGLPPGL